MSRQGMGFGWLKPTADARNFQFLMRTQAPEIKKQITITPRKRKYNEGPQLDQGNTPRCVGYSGRGFLNAAPIMSKAEPNANPGQDKEAARLYLGAQDNDEWNGTNYDGSSVLGLMRYMSSTGEISSYTWGKTVEEATAWMNGGFGTVILGSYWYPEMDNVNAKGVMQEPTTLSSPIGGHAYRINWFDKKLGLYLVNNSWGLFWGLERKDGYTGYAYMTPSLFERLLKEDGELAGPTQVRLKAVRV